ncbi:hypothetical protein J2T09_003923 [Neorhizobium huautlense]|uniref:Uncharacterized protein n=1 Tax=Neorhizobium huautlense TaxID=67774 RepID=A0ABT9PYI2_9HYPH|nr:hypothetical protein [Neorhizobium huautlense]MDP9839148.1 hypothetical protein [Neorhizobium huautlense]
MKRNRKTRLIVLGAVGIAYALVLIFWGSPLLAFTTWMGWVDPQAAR